VSRAVSPDDVVARWLAVVVLVFAATALTYRSNGLALEPRGLVGIAAGEGALLVLQAYAALRKLARVQDVARWAFWGVLVSTLYAVPMYALAHRAVAFHDEGLRHADGWLGVDVAAIAHWVRARPWADGASIAAYQSLPLGCIAALVVPSLAGAPEATRTMLVALGLASFLTLAVYGVFRGVGPWIGYAGLAPTAEQAACGDLCRALAGGARFVVDVQRPDPLIAFPSWHTILAALAAAALARVRFLGPVACAWGAAVALSTVTTGWHYAVDTVAGLVLAGGCWAAARAVLRAR
jgi:membrane-associated phospholipid phosphatase